MSHDIFKPSNLIGCLENETADSAQTRKRAIVSIVSIVTIVSFPDPPVLRWERDYSHQTLSLSWRAGEGGSGHETIL